MRGISRAAAVILYDMLESRAVRATAREQALREKAAETELRSDENYEMGHNAGRKSAYDACLVYLRVLIKEAETAGPPLPHCLLVEEEENE